MSGKGLLSYYELVELVEAGVIDAPLEAVNGTSIDVRVGSTLLVETPPGFDRPDAMIVDISDKANPMLPKFDRIDIPEGGYYDLRPGGCALAATVERFRLPPDISCEMKLKSSVARCFLNNMLATWCFVGNTEIPLLDGTSCPISELVGRDEWVYSLDMRGRVAPGRATNVVQSGEALETVVVTLDSGASFECTPEHLIMHRSGGYVPAGELYPGMALMPLQRRKGADGVYEESYGTSMRKETRKRWAPTHRLVYEAVHGKCPKGQVVHHIDHNPANNRPDNLVAMDAREHFRLHSNEYSRSAVARERASVRAKERLKLMWADEGFVERKKAASSAFISAYNAERWANPANRRKAAEWNVATEAYKSLIEYRETQPEEATVAGLLGHVLSALKRVVEAGEAITEQSYTQFKRQNAPTVATLIKYCGSFEAAVERSGYLNHTVIGVDRVRHARPVPVYDMTIPGYRNFAIGAGVFVHNCDPWWGLETEEDTRLTLEIHNCLQNYFFRIRPGMRLGQMAFFRVAPVPRERGYAVRGQYNATAEPTASKGVSKDG